MMEHASKAAESTASLVEFMKETDTLIDGLQADSASAKYDRDFQATEISKIKADISSIRNSNANEFIALKRVVEDGDRWNLYCIIGQFCVLVTYLIVSMATRGL